MKITLQGSADRLVTPWHLLFFQAVAALCVRTFEGCRRMSNDIASILCDLPIEF